jgi:hypothetical protein
MSWPQSRSQFPVEVPQQQPEHGISEDPILLAGLLAGTPIENLIGSIAIHQHALGLPALYLNSGFASAIVSTWNDLQIRGIKS